MSKYLSENDIKRKLKVRDLGQLSKDKTAQLVTLLPEMEPEVAIKMIEQFPEFSKLATSMVGYLKETVSQVLAENRDSTKHAFRAYQLLLNDLSEQLKKPLISTKEKHFITEKMLEVADRIAALDAENKNFLQKLAVGFGTVALAVVAIAGAVIGVNINKKG